MNEILAFHLMRMCMYAPTKCHCTMAKDKVFQIPPPRMTSLS